MQVSVEDKEGLEKLVQITFEATEVSKAIQTRLQSLCKTVKLNGFRPGKVPFAVVKNKYEPQVEAEIVQEKISHTIFQAISQEKLEVVAYPQIQDYNFDKKNNQISYSFTCEIQPEITLTPLNELAVDVPSVTIEDTDIDETIEKIRKQQRHFHSVERAAQKGDQITINFTGRIDGELFQGGEGKDTPIILGEGQMLPDFEQGLFELEKGQNKEINVNFPDNYPSEEVAGKDAVFEIEVIDVAEPHLPELNEDFFEQMGVEGDEKAFREEICKNMQIELDKQIANARKTNAMNALFEANTIQTPKALVHQEAQNLAEQMKKQFNIQGDHLQDDTSLFNDEAEKKVALGLILSHIIKENELKVSVEEVDNKIDDMSQSYEDPQQVINYYQDNKEKREEIESFLLEEKVIEFICSQAKCNEVSSPFNEFMNKK